MDECPVCGSDLLEITSLSEAVGRYLCLAGHMSVEVPFRPHRYSPPLLYMDPRDMTPFQWTMDSSLEPIMGWMHEPRPIYCGPPAPYPAVPTPDDILRGAGLHPDQMLDL